jgi:hypothetical protein
MYTRQRPGFTSLVLRKTTGGSGTSYVFVSRRYYRGKLNIVQVALGNPPQITAKYAYLKSLILPTGTTAFERWQHTQKLDLFNQYFHYKKILKTLEEQNG